MHNLHASQAGKYHVLPLFAFSLQPSVAGWSPPCLASPHWKGQGHSNRAMYSYPSLDRQPSLGFSLLTTPFFVLALLLYSYGSHTIPPQPWTRMVHGVALSEQLEHWLGRGQSLHNKAEGIRRACDLTNLPRPSPDLPLSLPLPACLTTTLTLVPSKGTSASLLLLLLLTILLLKHYAFLYSQFFLMVSCIRTPRSTLNYYFFLARSLRYFYL